MLSVAFRLLARLLEGVSYAKMLFWNQHTKRHVPAEHSLCACQLWVSAERFGEHLVNNFCWMIYSLDSIHWVVYSLRDIHQNDIHRTILAGQYSPKDIHWMIFTEYAGKCAALTIAMDQWAHQTMWSRSTCWVLSTYSVDLLARIVLNCIQSNSPISLGFTA